MLIAAPTRQRGVSLLEFMVAFTLVGILTAVAVPSFRDWIQNSQVRTAAESISNGITYARSEAIARTQPVSEVIACDRQRLAVNGSNATSPATGHGNWCRRAAPRRRHPTLP
ncbi:MAG: GspH/FimT family pseudopilin [Burkholderiales bacterium]|nr:GspH/FimT family pseudopilin [Burkholderiales bacterium]